MVQKLFQESTHFQKQGQNDSAVLCLKKILQIQFNVSSLGLIDYAKALQEKNAALSEFAKIVINTKLTEYQIDFASTVSNLRIEKWDSNIEKAMLLCLQNPSIDPQTIAAAAISMLHYKTFSPHDPLLLSLMETVVIADAKLEKLLTVLRKKLLFNADHSAFLESHRSFIYALSLQCSINEYVYDITDDESALVEQLLKRINLSMHLLDSQTKLLITLLSCYLPLHTTSLSQTLFNLPYPNEDVLFSRILKMQVFDEFKEEELLSTIII